MRTQDTQTHSTGTVALSMLARWTPRHHSLEAEAAELSDLAERDAAARTAFARKAIRGVITAALLVIGVTATTPAQADPIPATPPDRIYVPAPAAPRPIPIGPLPLFEVPAQAHPIPDQSVSPTMQTMIDEFVTASTRQTSEDRSKALTALAFHQPANLVELAAKTTALTEFANDSERWSLRVLVLDMNKLAEGQ